MSYKIVFKQRNKGSQIIRNVDHYELRDKLYCFIRDNVIVWTERIEDVKTIKSEEGE